MDKDEVRQQTRARLQAGPLSLINGISKSQRGTGRPCLVCLLAITSLDVEREVEGAGVFFHAHEACYKIWREESTAHRATAPEQNGDGLS